MRSRCPGSGERRRGGEAFGAVAADFGARDGDFHAEVAGDLLFQLFVETAFEFADFAAAQAGHVDVVAWAVALVIVAGAAESEPGDVAQLALPPTQVGRPCAGAVVGAGARLVPAGG